MGARGSALAADSVVLALTFMEACRILRFSGGLGGSSVIRVMSQQGELT